MPSFKSLTGGREAAIKAVLTRDLRLAFPRYEIFRHEDRITAGVPDISVNGAGMTVWLEVKHAHPAIRSRGIQDLTLKRLCHGTGLAFYVIYYEAQDKKCTYVIRPRWIHHSWANWKEAQCETFADGFDHRSVIEWLRRLHGDHFRTQQDDRRASHSSHKGSTASEGA